MATHMILIDILVFVIALKINFMIQLMPIFLRNSLLGKLTRIAK